MFVDRVKDCSVGWCWDFHEQIHFKYAITIIIIIIIMIMMMMMMMMMMMIIIIMSVFLERLSM